MREIKRIFVHCTAGSQKQTKDDLLREFKAKGWTNPGYHYAVFPDGRVVTLLAEEKVSNGVQGYNSTAINVAYVGGIDSKGKAVDNRTDAQKQSLRDLLKRLKIKYPQATILGHRDIWGKDPSKWKKQCPCFDAQEEYKYITSDRVVQYKDIYVNDYTSKYIDSILELRPWADKHKRKSE